MHGIAAHSKHIKKSPGLAWSTDFHSATAAPRMPLNLNAVYTSCACIHSHLSLPPRALLPSSFVPTPPRLSLAMASDEAAAAAAAADIPFAAVALGRFVGKGQFGAVYRGDWEGRVRPGGGTRTGRRAGVGAGQRGGSLIVWARPRHACHLDPNRPQSMGTHAALMFPSRPCS